MESDTNIPEGYLSSNPLTENLDNLRPNKKGSWTVPSQNNPEVVAQLVEKRQEAIPLAKLVLNTNAPQVTVYYQTGADDPYQAVTDKKTGTPKVSASALAIALQAPIWTCRRGVHEHPLVLA